MLLYGNDNNYYCSCKEFTKPFGGVVDMYMYIGRFIFVRPLQDYIAFHTCMILLKK